MAVHGREDWDQTSPFAGFPDNLPVLVIAGWDRAGPKAARAYARFAEEVGADAALVQSALRLADAMVDYQAIHGSKVPDLKG